MGANAVSHELTEAASQKCMGSGIPAPPNRVGRHANSHCASETEVPNKTPHVERSIGDTWLAVQIEVKGSAVRRMKVTLMPLRHWRSTRLAP